MTMASPPSRDDPEHRIVVAAPTRRDGAFTTRLLAGHGLTVHVCPHQGELDAELRRGAAALIVPDSLLDHATVSRLEAVLSEGPRWSALPVLVLARSGPPSPAVLRLQGAANVVLLERPVPVRSLVSATLAAVRARDRQYEIRDLLERLREADRQKDEFLATLAHELRNPLAPVRTGLELMRLSGELPAGLERTRAMMQRQVTHMARLIDDLLDVSRITAGKIELRQAVVRVADLLRRAAEATQSFIDAARLQFVVDLPDESAVVYVDETRMVQVLSNLLHNAAKFTHEGGRIDLRAGVTADAVAIHVIDSGEGIPLEMLDRVFDLFAQGRTSGQTAGGLGIGLTLARRLVELHGGRLGVTSRGPGTGSDFVVHLPRLRTEHARPDHESAERHHAAGARAWRVLVVDDNADAAESLTEMIRLLGATVVTAFNGQHALDAASEFRPHLVFLDIGLPDMDGYEVCRRIRRQGWSDTTQLVALTGWGQPHDRRQAADAGFDVHLTKPAEPDDIERLLASLGTT